MKAKPVVPRHGANRDIDEAISYYLRENAEQGALGCIDSLERADVRIGRHPATGSPGYAHQLNSPGLRSWPREPSLIFGPQESVGLLYRSSPVFGTL